MGVARIDYSDLIGLPYEAGGSSPEGCDCVGVGRLALLRMGAPLEDGDLPTDEAALWASLSALSGDPHESPWLEIGSTTGRATRLGDIVLARSSGGSHVGVLVDEKRHILLTACAPLWRMIADPGVDLPELGDPPLVPLLVREGVTYATPARRVRGCIGVYRLRRWSAPK